MGNLYARVFETDRKDFRDGKPSTNFFWILGNPYMAATWTCSPWPLRVIFVWR